MKKSYYEVGSWNLICDSCGKNIKSKHARHRWDGFIVCDGCFEHRHPQDFVRAKPERNQVPFSRPRPTDVFVSGVCSTRTAVAGIGVAGCMISGLDL